MSSGIDGAGVIFLPAALAAAAVIGAAATVQGIVTGAIAVNAAVVDAEAQMHDRLRREAEQKQQQAEEKRQQIREICLKTRDQLETACRNTGPADWRRLQDLVHELDGILSEDRAGSTGEQEIKNVSAFGKVQSVLLRSRELIGAAAERTFLYTGYAVADIMDDLRMAFRSVELSCTMGQNAGVNVDDYERGQLNERLDRVTARICEALKAVSDYSSTIGLDPAKRTWYSHLFENVDQTIADLRSPETGNEQVRKGILRLEKVMKEYDMLEPDYLKDRKRITVIYEEYRKAAQAMAEKPLHIRAFNGDADAICRETERLAARAQRAEECRRIYTQFGPEVYQCYAWDTELKAMGYTTFKRRQFTQLAFGDSGTKLERTAVDGQELPFYNWGSDGTVTQLYEIGEGCALQLKLNPDGSTTMQTVDVSEDTDTAVIRTAQKKHCSAMKELRDRLRDNWFIYTDLEEIRNAEQVLSVSGWRNAEGIAEGTVPSVGIAGTAAAVQGRAAARHLPNN